MIARFKTYVGIQDMTLTDRIIVAVALIMVLLVVRKLPEMWRTHEEEMDDLPRGGPKAA